MAGLDIDLVRHALTVARARGLAEVDITHGDDRFSARFDPYAPPPPAAADPAGSGETADAGLKAITSTLVGYFREAPTPLVVGERVEAGQVVGVIAALGISNDIESKLTGEVVEVLVESGQAVEFGQVLARVKV